MRAAQREMAPRPPSIDPPSGDDRSPVLPEVALFDSSPPDATLTGPDPALTPEAVPQANKGSFRLGRVARTDVYIHWSWFVAAVFLINDSSNTELSLPWKTAEYLAGFLLVLLHEFGHVLACRTVGGTANRIVLWPLGGLAFVAPPPRPWPTLWTIVAGPLVNVALAPVLFGWVFMTWPGDEAEPTNLSILALALATFNVGLLIFNLLPIYPLDGGRILQALLWRLFGLRASLLVAGGIGVVAGTGLALLAVSFGEWWLTAVAAFLVIGAWSAVKQASILKQQAQAQREAAIEL